MSVAQDRKERLITRLTAEVVKARAREECMMAQFANIKEALTAQNGLRFDFDFDLDISLYPCPSNLPIV